MQRKPRRNCRSATPGTLPQDADEPTRHWAGLTRFLDDLRIPLDNNGSELANRGPAVGRKNYYGSGSLWAGRLAEMLFSLFATTMKCGLNPCLWLTWYLESCALAGGCIPDDTAKYLLGT